MFWRRKYGWGVGRFLGRIFLNFDERRFLDTLLSETKEAIFAKDLEGRYLMVNPVAQGVIGKPLRDILGKRDSELFPQGVARVLRKVDLEVVKSGEAVVVEENVPHPGGMVHVWRSTKSPLKDSKGEIVGVLGVSRDVTEVRKQEGIAERLLEQKKERIAELDRAAQSLIRRDLELSEVRTKQEGQIAELDGVAKNLIRRDLELSEVRTKQEDQIVELKRASRMLVRRDFELTLAKERLERLNREKSEFLSIAAHQLRTPLTGIKWPLAVLLKKFESERSSKKKRELIEQALGSTEQMIALVNDFLSVVRIEEGRLGYDPKQGDLRDFVRKAVDVVRGIVKGKAISFSFEVEEDVPNEVVFDEQKMIIVAQNILDNALKFAPKKGKVSFVVGVQEGKILFSVSDNGLGIPEDEQDKIFHKFSMASNAIMYEGGKGTGLGLYLTKNIVEAHGGRIWFESREGKGTTFYFTLPLKPAV